MQGSEATLRLQGSARAGPAPWEPWPISKPDLLSKCLPGSRCVCVGKEREGRNHGFPKAREDPLLVEAPMVAGCLQVKHRYFKIRGCFLGFCKWSSLLKGSSRRLERQEQNPWLLPAGPPKLKAPLETLWPQQEVGTAQRGCAATLGCAAGAPGPGGGGPPWEPCDVSVCRAEQ